MTSRQDTRSHSGGLVIAGTRSGCGKTLTTLGLAAALRGRGLEVQGFKVGPDFIDPTHLAAVSGRPVHNLDGWILRQEVVLELFHRFAADADVCLVEGVMGLFDGASGTTEEGSTAQMAKWLGLPVILVVDARSQGRSAAALVRGFVEFDPDLSLAGVVFTQVGGANHVELLREAMATSLPHVTCLGFLPRRPDLCLPSRHLGLHMAEELSHGSTLGCALATWIEQSMDLERLLLLSRQVETRAGLTDPWEESAAAVPGSRFKPRCSGSSEKPGSVDTERELEAPVRLGVARDRAFCFFYPENLRLLEQAGAQVVFFSPIADAELPEGVQGLFLGGGYPELYAQGLAANTAMHRAVRRAAGAGMPIYAECGGMMYLQSELQDGEGKAHPMVGLFAGRARMCDRFQALGYRKIELLTNCLLGPAGTQLRGHEFHYSRIDGHPGFAPTPAFWVEDRRGRRSCAGYQWSSVLASYVHVHFGSHSPAAKAFITACHRWAATTNQRI
ncbi:MAG: cobyrinate a,c-diamide synthase [Desulfovibrionales bacterium]|nr:MAG: cobyrinate a,c-diamide synthase [Desulfovibrionales bacterium]